MRKIILTIAIAIVSLTSFAQEKKFENPDSDARGYLVKVGDKAPDDFELVLENGKKTSLKELRGKIVILQFTASWCHVCREEMPYLESDIWQAYKNKDVVLIGVDRNEPLATVQKFSKDMKITYPLALDSGAVIFQKFADKKAGITRNVVIGRDGYIKFLTRLYDKAEFASLVDAVDRLSKEKISSK